MLFLLLGVLILALLIILLVLLLRRRFRPQPAAPKPPSDCSVPPFPPGVMPPQQSDPAQLPLDGTVTGGFITGPTLSLPAGTTISLSSSLTLVAAGDLSVDGIISVPPGSPPIDIVLVSLEKDVVIGPTGQIRGGVAANGAAAIVSGRSASASGGGASFGGSIKLIAPRGSVKVFGSLSGQAGGRGGNATATATATTFGGCASAVGGEGGEGGDIRLCALELIVVQGTVEGGRGGSGGQAQPSASNSTNAFAQGGPGNLAGNVYLDGLGSTPCQVVIAGEIRALSGGSGGVASAIGGDPGRSDGGTGEALAGDGQRGGTVIFNRCLVIQVGPVKAGIGGNGGDAFASGGRGANALLGSGDSGGNAIAFGGNGGNAGTIPTSPRLPVLCSECREWRTLLASGKGGLALAGSGPGGTGGRLGAGGSSGSALAAGGSSGNNGAPGQRQTATPKAGAPAPNGAGGAGTTVGAPGAP